MNAKMPPCASIYPDGIHATIAGALALAPFEGQVPIAARTATLDAPDHGLSEERLADCDVLLWWGHKAHGEVSDGRGRPRAAPRCSKAWD